MSPFAKDLCERSKFDHTMFVGSDIRQLCMEIEAAEAKTAAAGTPEMAIKILREAFAADPEYAWGWHCNLAMLAVDAGAPHREANLRAANFMHYVFGVDTRENPHYHKDDK